MMKRTTQNGFLLLFLFMLLPAPIHAHGVKGTTGVGGVCVSASYDTDEAMSYAAVTIRAPEGALDFQTGRTDRNGRFCFFPDGTGEWDVIVSDGMGHRLELVVPVAQASPAAGVKIKEHKQEASLSKYEKAAMGLSIIFGISGCLLWWGSRKHARRKPGEE